MSQHPPDCNCPECSAVDPPVTKRLKRLTSSMFDSLTEKEKALVRARFELPKKDKPDPGRE